MVNNGETTWDEVVEVFTPYFVNARSLLELEVVE